MSLLVRLLTALALLATAGCQTAPAPASPEPSRPRNVIILIGDGMGASHFTVLDQIRAERSTLQRFHHAGMVTIHSADSLVPDSGSTATAIAAGVRTRNGSLSVTPDGEPVPTVLQLAEQAGKATGLITTTGFWDATPAAFAAHTPSRGATDEIVRQMLATGVELIISNKIETLEAEGRPTLDELAAIHGYHPVRSPSELLQASEGAILAVFPAVENDIDHPDAPLASLTRFAIERLSRDPEGFFLMVEHEGTDTASHRNLDREVLDSLRSLDEAVTVALDFARERGDTLVIFTSDHETGALQIGAKEDGALELQWFSRRHTGQAVPLFAHGPGARDLSGWIDGPEIGIRLKKLISER